MRSHSTKSLRRNITNKPARPKRVQRVASELALIKAFEELLQSKGVDGIGVNAVLNRAGVGKRLLYEYFGDLTSLASAWAKTHRDPLALTSRHRLISRIDQLPIDAAVLEIIIDYATSLRQHPWAAQILLAEMTQKSALGAGLKQMRQEIGAGHEKLLMRAAKRADRGTMARGFVLHAAANYLALRALFAPDFNGLDLSTASGWKKAMRMLRSANVAGKATLPGP